MLCQLLCLPSFYYVYYCVCYLLMMSAIVSYIFILSLLVFFKSSYDIFYCTIYLPMLLCLQSSYNLLSASWQKPAYIPCQSLSATIYVMFFFYFSSTLVSALFALKLLLSLAVCFHHSGGILIPKLWRDLWLRINKVLMAYTASSS
jgi:hypothetical protein